MILDDILKLYPDYDTVYGPYKRNDNRKHIVLSKSSVSHGPGKLKTISFPKALMEISLQRRLLKTEEVDHKDGDKTNDDIRNLQLLSKIDNLKKQKEEGKLVNPWEASVAKHGLEKAKGLTALGDKSKGGKANKGKSKSEDHKKKISESLKGKYNKK